MVKSLIYVGNSISDGMPNTLLEALIMGALPIQSNPGGGTAEIIEDGVNGLLIENPESINEIQHNLMYAFSNRTFLSTAFEYNYNKRDSLSYISLTEKVLNAYSLVFQDLN